MTAFVPTTTNIGSSVIYSSVAAGDSVTFLQPYTFINTSGNAVNLTYANNTVVNMTTVMSGGSYGLVVNSVADCEIVNTATGTIATLSGVSGFNAVYLIGDRNSLRNDGAIYSINGSGVNASGDDFVIVNSGSIRGRDVGLIAGGIDYAITNSGTIESEALTNGTAVFLSGNGTNKVLINTGVIQTLAPSGGIAIQVSGFNATTITNSGIIRSAGGVAIDASSSTGALFLDNSGTISSNALSASTIFGSGRYCRELWHHQPVDFTFGWR